MEWIVGIAVWLVGALTRAYERKWRFLGLFVVAFAGSVYALGIFGLLPESPVKEVAPKVGIASRAVATASEAGATVAERAEEPVQIEIPSIGLTATVANPTSTNIEVLDEHLLRGAVRYPTSALLGKAGNVVLFGHSSYLPVVGNQAYKTFNGIQKLVVGDVIAVSSAGTMYTYRVRTMTKASAADAGIPLAVSGRVLTLATCNSFGTKSDRFIVIADFVESHSISI